MVVSKKLISREFLPKSANLKLLGLSVSEQGWAVEAGGGSFAVCPACGTRSTSRHSRYIRTLQDLPVQGSAVILHLQVGRWRCGNDRCSRKMFTERISKAALPWARRTNRFREVVELIGHGMGGRPAERLMSRLGMPISDDTILRAVKQVNLDTGGVPQRVLGIDDWAWKKGQTYGTILVDLEHSVVVDLLPERSAESLAAWLAQHPEIEFISRDRHGLYADGARRGAPQAQQVADRFHLALNLSVAVEQELARHRPFLSIPKPVGTSTAPTAPLEDGASCSGAVIDHHRIEQGRRVAKQALFETVRTLHESGKTVSCIVRETGIGKKRISAWVGLEELPERNRMEPNPRTPAFYQDYLAKRWAEGCRHGHTLMEELQEIGYTGCFSYLARFLALWRRKPSTPVAFDTTMPTASITPLELVANSLCRQISPQVAAALLGKLRPQMTVEQENIVDALKKDCPGYAMMRSLVMGFRTTLRTGKIETLHDWMKRACDSGIYGMQRFVRTLKQDLSAVEAAVEQTWSNGPVEGHINKLKTIKRQMYGRAGFELLRARILPLPQYPSLHQK
jgi:transposase